MEWWLWILKTSNLFNGLQILQFLFELFVPIDERLLRSSELIQLPLEVFDRARQRVYISRRFLFRIQLRVQIINHFLQPDDLRWSAFTILWKFETRFKTATSQNTETKFLHNVSQYNENQCSKSLGVPKQRFIELVVQDRASGTRPYDWPRKKTKNKWRITHIVWNSKVCETEFGSWFMQRNLQTDQLFGLEILRSSSNLRRD